MKLIAADISSLHSAATMRFMGGSMPFYYEEYRRREKLRRRGLLRFFRRRNRRWDWCCYDITAKGDAALEAAQIIVVRKARARK